MSRQILSKITDQLLDETSPSLLLKRALDDFSALCSQVTDIHPEATFDAWAGDTFLDTGVAINPQAAAQCVQDYRRSVVFIRGVHAALMQLKREQPGRTLRILYAGCGPFATQLLPLLTCFESNDLEIHLLDIHQSALDSVQQLIGYFDLKSYAIQLIQGDASGYQHSEKLDLIIAETMQKSLEQEPQVAVSINLAPQLSDSGVFIPQTIDVDLCLLPMHSSREKLLAETKVLAQLMSLRAEFAERLHRAGDWAARAEVLKQESQATTIPDIDNLADYQLALFTGIQVFGPYRLEAGECDITLPQLCTEFSRLEKNQTLSVYYELSQYPRFVLSQSD